ncbi:MAG: OB-fold nucleic acid binding domain-containing protein [Methanoregula sp.]|nr:MAG: OB-fold nucleic acid binding domain-containing protein [Methanoregula sp.]
MLFHYALVDDLITREEFEERVGTKIDSCGDLVDESTAAMLVVGELGRAHVKIQGLSGRSSLFSFFAKVIDKTELRVFDRPDGEKGAVATLLLGDETGTVRVVLWDERAGAVEEIAKGDVLEVIGRHSGKSAKEIYALALRKASCTIECNVPEDSAESLRAEPVDLDVLLIDLEEPRPFTRKDGTGGEMVEAVIGDAHGTARLVAWTPEVLAGILPGASIHITGAKPNMRGEGRAYSIDDKSTVAVTDAQVSTPLTPIGSVGDRGTYSVQGDVKRVQEPRAFKTRDGRASWVRNIIITDGRDDINVVLWGEKALLPITPGTLIEIYYSKAKPGRFHDIELGVGRGSAIRIPEMQSGEIVFEGTVIISNGNTFIDNGRVRYLVEGCDLPRWHEVRVNGMMSGNRIKPGNFEPLTVSPEEVRKKAKDLQDMLVR